MAKQSSEHLYDLIKSLNPSEKRYLTKGKLFSRFGGNYFYKSQSDLQYESTFNAKDITGITAI